MATSWDLIMKYASHRGTFPLPDPADATATVVEPGCGDELTIAFRTQREIVTDPGYTISEGACQTVHACVCAALELVRGKPVLEAYATLTHKRIAQMLSDDGTLDREHLHCAMMAELAFKRAVASYSTAKRNALLAANAS